MKRRSFLTHLAHGAAVPGVLGSMGFKLPAGHSMKSLLRLATEQDKVLVLIFLEGGNDGLNTVIPMDQLSNLNRVRPHVVLPEDKLISLPQSEVALHPSMSDLAALYREGRFQVIQNVGYPLPNYSHFRSTDIWMSGSDSDELLNSGLAGRYLTDVFPGYPEVYPTESMPDPLAVEIGYGGSLLFQGPEAAMSMVISDPNFFYELVDNEEQVAPNSPAGDKLKYVRLIERQSQQYGEIVKSAAEKGNNSVDYPETSLGEQLKIVSRLIAGGLKTPIYMVRLGGFDTHDAQVEAGDHTKGEHAELLKELNDAISAFMKDTDALRTSDKVLGMTFSEFGRRIVSNASLGTDHGAAAPMFIFGNHVVGGVTGANPIISPSAIYDDNLPWEFDFRQVYASVFDQWFAAGSGTISNAMLNDYTTTPIIGDSRILDLSSPSADRGISVYPNPVTSHATIFVSDIRSPVRMTVIDLAGRVVAKPFTGKLSSQQFEWDASQLRSGRYVLTVQGSDWQKSYSVLKK